MSATELVCWIGWSHLLQPPLTLLLASSHGLNLHRSFVFPSPVASAAAQNMAIASVMLPTTLGVLLAWRSEDVFRTGTAQDLAVVMAGFWSWRLYRQVRALGPNWPRPLRALHVLLLGVFLAQGPVLAGVLWWSR